MIVEVAYGVDEQKQYLLVIDVPENTSVEKAIELSGIYREIPDLQIDKVGVFAKLVSMDTLLKEGDRIEIYRPLKVDPRKRRREKVEKERSEKS